MDFFYNLNKRLADLSAKQDASPINEGMAKRLPGLPITKKDVEKKFGGSAVKMAQAAKKAGFSDARIAQATDDLTQGKNPNDVAEADYSAKKARAGKDLGKPGKNFSKIAKSAGKEYGSKAAGERVAGAVLNKLRHPKEDITDEGNAFTGALAKTSKGNRFKVGNKEFTDTSNIEETNGVSMTPKQKSFAKLAPPEDKITFADKIAGAKKEVDEMLGDVAADAMRKAIVGHAGEEEMDEGYAEMDSWLKQREKEKGTGRFDKRKVSTGTVYTRRPETFASDEEETTKEPKGRGRPKGKDKGPERVTAKSYKYKNGRPAKTKEDIDSDGVMMTKPSNMSSEGAGDITDKGEYDQEGQSAKHDIKTIVRHAQALYKILGGNENLPEWVQSKLAKIESMMIAVDEYMQNRDTEEVTEKAVSKKQQRFMGMVHATQKGEKAPSKEVAKVAKEMPKKAAKDFAATKHKGLPNKVKEESTDKEDNRAEKAGKKVAKDIEHDEGHKGRDDNRAEKAGKKVTRDIEYDDKKDKETDRSKVKKDIAADRIQNKIKSTKDKEEKVDETTTSGSVATATSSGKSSSGGMQFGKGVYEGINNSIEKMISEGITVESRMEECGDGNMAPGITVTADGEEAAKLMMLLKLAGLDSQIPSTCPTCGNAPCNCAEVVDENSPNWPTNTETSNNALQYSGGLNKPKSTGQTTTPVIANQGRQTSMEESVKLERSLFNTWKNYKG